MNEIPMDSLMALAADRRRRYTAEAERFRLARLAVRSRRGGRRRRQGGDGGTAATGTRVTLIGDDRCA